MEGNQLHTACHVPSILNQGSFCPSFYKLHVSINAYKKAASNTHKGEGDFTAKTHREPKIITTEPNPHTHTSIHPLL